MKSTQLIALVVIVSSVTIVATRKSWRPDQKAKFQAWKATYNKAYATSGEEQIAMDQTLQNSDEIEAHNKRFKAEKETFSRGLWNQSDLSFTEKQQMLTGLKNLSSDSTILQAAPMTASTPPSHVNWTAAGLVGPVEDQQTCGSCYAFATVGVTEGVMLKQNISTRLSVQQIIDCSTGNYGCGGGEPFTGLRYVKNQGLSSAQSYPYKNKRGKCQNLKSIGSVLSVSKANLYGDENRLKRIVANNGPVAVAINAADSLMNYMTGVYNNPKCSKQQDHAVLLVGYGTDAKYGDYWLVKNSWGITWGELGYVRMARNRKGSSRNMCGIATTVWYAA